MASIPATSARRLPGLYLAAAADRTDALPGTFRARPVARRDGDRLLRFPRLAGSDLRRRPRRTVRGAQRRQSGAGLSSRTAAPMASRRRWNMRSSAAHQAHRGARPCPMRRHPRLHRRYRSAVAGRFHRPLDGDVHQAGREGRASASARPGRISPSRIEKAAVFRSLENLMTFPFVRTPRRARRDGICTAPISASPRARCSCSTRRRRNSAASGKRHSRSRVGWAKRSVPTISPRLCTVWWTRRKCAFAHPTRSRYAAFFLAVISLRLIRHSAIWIAFSAAPLRRLSDTHHSDRPFSTVLSSRMRLI